MAASNSSIAAASSSPAGVDSVALSADKGGANGAAAESVRGASSATPKASRTSLSIHEKSIVKSYCEQKIDECKARGEVVPSQDVLRREVLAKFGWQMGRSTLSKVMTMDWKALNVGSHRNPNMKRKRKPLFPDFEADLVQYISAHIAQHEALAAADTDDMIAVGGGSSAGEMGMAASSGGDDSKQHAMLLPNDIHAVKMAAPQPPKNRHVLTEAIILEEAQRLKQVHGIKDEQLVLSVGWLARFKHRNGIRLRKASSTSASHVAQALHKVGPIPPPPFGSSHNATALPSDLFDTSAILHPGLVEPAAPVGGNPPRKQSRLAEPSSAFGLSPLPSAAAGASAEDAALSASRLFWAQHASGSSRQRTRRLSI